MFAVEQSLKLFLLKSGEKPEHTHKLYKLLKSAQDAGLSNVDVDDVKKLEIRPYARYVNNSVSSEDALARHHLSIRVANTIAKELEKHERISIREL
jgi:HEPN domain-containing protein